MRHAVPHELDEIRLENLEVNCVVGLYPREKLAPQPLIVNLSLYLDTRRAGRTVSLADTIDYAAVATEIRFVLEHARFRLLETAADALSHLLLAPPLGESLRACPTMVDLQLKKPAALGGGAVASVTVRRSAAEVAARLVTPKEGAMETLHESADCCLYRLMVPKNGETSRYHHPASDGAEVAISDGLILEGKPLGFGESRLWNAGITRCYQNPTSEKQGILGVIRGDVRLFTRADPKTTGPAPKVGKRARLDEQPPA